MRRVLGRIFGGNGEGSEIEDQDFEEIEQKLSQLLKNFISNYKNLLEKEDQKLKEYLRSFIKDFNYLFHSLEDPNKGIIVDKEPISFQFISTQINRVINSYLENREGREETLNQVLKLVSSMIKGLKN